MRRHAAGFMVRRMRPGSVWRAVLLGSFYCAVLASPRHSPRAEYLRSGKQSNFRDLAIFSACLDTSIKERHSHHVYRRPCAAELALRFRGAGRNKSRLRAAAKHGQLSSVHWRRQELCSRACSESACACRSNAQEEPKHGRSNLRSCTCDRIARPFHISRQIESLTLARRLVAVAERSVCRMHNNDPEPLGAGGPDSFK